jgi:hypothetical protein
MPTVCTSSNSTTRRLNLADFIDSFRDTMVQKCSSYTQYSLIYKVHLRSRKCNYCNRKNIRYDVKVI